MTKGEKYAIIRGRSEISAENALKNGRLSMNKKISLGAAVALMAIIAAVTFSITMVYARQTFNSTILNIKERETTYTKLSEIDKWVRQNYYGTIDSETLMDSISSGYIGGIGDPYAKYYTVDEFQRQNQEGTAKSVDVGIVTEVDESGYIRITEVYPDSPALAAGIQAGDMIVKIDETDLTVDNVEEMIQSLQGEAGTKLDLVVRRDNVDTPYPLTRREVEKPSVYGSLLQNGVGYVQILEFGTTTSDQFSRAVDKLVSDGAVALVFDVRGNQGRTNEACYRILDKLLPQCNIATSVDKNGEEKVQATSDPAHINLPMTVLINEQTAAAAEIFAQALKDVKSASLVGVTTLGKGTMQVTQQLDDGSAIDITVAKVLTPGGQSFDGVGVKPDYEVSLSKDQAEAASALEKTSAERVELAVQMDPQLKKALELAATAGNVAGVSAPLADDRASSSEDAAENNTEDE